jgi:hypothetical protein
MPKSLLTFGVISGSTAIVGAIVGVIGVDG